MSICETEKALEVEIPEGDYDTLSGYLIEELGRIPDEKENILKQGDWNTLRIRVEGAHVQTWLNGELMADLTDKKIGATQGRIALQIHDGGGIKVQWRNIRLTRL